MNIKDILLEDNEISDLQQRELATLLDTHSNGIKSVPMLEGYLLGVICTSEPIIPFKFLSEILKVDQVEGVDYRDVVSLIMLYHNVLAVKLYRGEQVKLMLYQAGVSKSDEWAMGFVMAMALDTKYWQAMMLNEEKRLFLAPIDFLAGINQVEIADKKAQKKMNKAKLEFEDILPIAITCLYNANRQMDNSQLNLFH